MNRKLCKWLCVLLAVVTVFSMLPGVVFGAGNKALFLDEDEPQDSDHYWGVEIYYYDDSQPEGSQTSQDKYTSNFDRYNFESNVKDKVTLQIHYWNTDVAQEYPAGTVRIKVTNPLYGNKDSQFALSSVTVSTTTKEGSENGHWRLETASDITSLANAEEWVFVNIVPFGNNYNFEGTIQIIFEVESTREHHSQNYGVKDPVERFLDSCKHTTGEQKIRATLVADADNDPSSTNNNQSRRSSTLLYEAERTYDHPWQLDEYTVNKNATELTNVTDFMAANNIDAATFEKYYWVRWDISTNASKLNEAYWMDIGGNQLLHHSAETLKFVDTGIPENALVYDLNGKLEKDSNNQYSYSFDLPTRDNPDIDYFTDEKGNSHWYVIVGYPKSDYYPDVPTLDTLDNKVELYAKYIKGDDPADKTSDDFIKQDTADAAVTIPPTAEPGGTPTTKPPVDPNPDITPTVPPNLDTADPGKEPTPPPSIPPTSTDPDPDITATPTTAPTPTPTPSGPITGEKWYELSKEYISEDTKYYSDLTNPNNTKGYEFRHRMSVYYNEALPEGTYKPDGKVSYVIEKGYGMDVVIGDDYLFVSSPNGGYRQLKETEYYFSNIKFPATLYNPYGPIEAGKYTVELYIRKQNQPNYELYVNEENSGTFKNTKTDKADEQKSFDLKKEDQVVAYYFVIRAMKESLVGNTSIERFNEFTSTIVPYGLDPDTTAKSGSLYNINYLKVYRERMENSRWGSQGWINQPEPGEYPTIATEGNVSDLDKQLPASTQSTRALVATLAETVNGAHGGLVMRAEDGATTLGNISPQMKIQAMKEYKDDNFAKTYDIDKGRWSGTARLGIAIHTTHIDDIGVSADSPELAAMVASLPDEYWCAGWEMYDLLPQGMYLDECDAQKIKDSMLMNWLYAPTWGLAFTKQGERLTGEQNNTQSSTLKQYLKEHTTVDITEDWNGTGRTHIAIIIDLSKNPIIVISTRGTRSQWGLNGTSHYTSFWADIEFDYDFYYDYQTGYKQNGGKTVYNGLLIKYHDRKGYPSSGDPYLREDYKWWLRYNSEYNLSQAAAKAIADPASTFSDKTFLLYGSASNPGGGTEKPGPSGGAVMEYKFKREMDDDWTGVLRDWQDINGDENYFDLAAYKDRTIETSGDLGYDINTAFMQYWFDHDQYFEYYQRAYASFLPQLAAGSFQSVTKEVAAGQTYFNPNSAQAELDGEYQYRIEINTGYSQLDDIVLYDDIEEYYLDRTGQYQETNSQWWGTFKSVNVDIAGQRNADNKLQSLDSIKVYYSENWQETNELYSLNDGVKNYSSSWHELTPNTDPKKVRSLAFEFVKKADERYTLQEDEKVYVTVTMTAPSYNADASYVAHNGAWTKWTANAPDGTALPNVTGINSNTVTVNLPAGGTPPSAVFPESGSAGLYILCGSAAALVVVGMIVRPKRKKRSMN